MAQKSAATQSARNAVIALRTTPRGKLMLRLVADEAGVSVSEFADGVLMSEARRRLAAQANSAAPVVERMAGESAPFAVQGQ